MAINRPRAGLHGELRAAKSSVYDPGGFTCSQPVPEPESADYAAHRFTLDGRVVAFRAARTNLNRSDILHFHHSGAPLTYHLIHPDGRAESLLLGQDPRQGQALTLAVPGGVWKATSLDCGDHALISEAVAPGFDYADMTLGDPDDLTARFPRHAALIQRYCRPDSARGADGPGRG